jgi:hypothetical protein
MHRFSFNRLELAGFLAGPFIAYLLKFERSSV